MSEHGTNADVTTEEVLLEPPMVIEEPIIVVETTLSDGLRESFYYGLSEGMYAFGVTFPFLVVFLLGWLATLLWIPFAVRIARRVRVSATQSARSLSADAVTLKHEMKTEAGLKEE